MRGLAVAAASLPMFGALAGTCLALEGQNRSLAIRGEAQSVCSFSPAQALQSANMALGPSPSSQNSISVGMLIDPATARQQAASISLTLKGLCNRAHSIRIGTGNGGLKPQNPLAAVPNGFSSRVDYRTQAVWASSASVLNTAGAAGQSTTAALTNGAFSGYLQMQIDIDPGGPGTMPVLAGTYTDKLIVTIQPQY